MSTQKLHGLRALRAVVRSVTLRFGTSVLKCPALVDICLDRKSLITFVKWLMCLYIYVSLSTQVYRGACLALSTSTYLLTRACLIFPNLGHFFPRSKRAAASMS